MLCGNEIPDLAKDGRENNEGNDTRGVKLGREVEQQSKEEVIGSG